jgi:hypothetical protein
MNYTVIEQNVLQNEINEILQYKQGLNMRMKLIQVVQRRGIKYEN